MIDNRNETNISSGAASPSVPGGNATRRTEGSAGPTVRAGNKQEPRGQSVGQPPKTGDPNSQAGRTPPPFRGNAASGQGQTFRGQASRDPRPPRQGAAPNRRPQQGGQAPNGGQGYRKPPEGGSTAQSGRRENGQAPKKQRKSSFPWNASNGTHRKGSIILLYSLIGVGFVLAIILLVRLLLLFVPIKEIVVAEGSFYTREELCSVAELEEGDRLYGFSGARVRKALKKEYLLLENVKLKRSLGGTLTIIPVEVESDFFVNVSGSYYLLSRDDYRVLMETDDRERLTEHGFYEISLPEVRVAFIGRPLDFGTEGKTEYLATLLKTLDSSFLEGRITGIRASSRFNLSFIVDGKYDVMIGNVTDLDKKLETLERLMQKEVFASGSDVEVNLTDLSAPTTRAVDQINTEVAE